MALSYHIRGSPVSIECPPPRLHPPASSGQGGVAGSGWRGGEERAAGAESRDERSCGAILVTPRY